MKQIYLLKQLNKTFRKHFNIQYIIIYNNILSLHLAKFDLEVKHC